MKKIAKASDEMIGEKRKKQKQKASPERVTFHAPHVSPESAAHDVVVDAERAPPKPEANDLDGTQKKF